LFYETAINARKLGYKYGEASWILEDNDRMNKSAEACWHYKQTVPIYELAL